MSVIVCDNVENNSDFECCDKSFPLGVNEGYQLGENDISSARNIAKLVSSTVAKECVVLPENSELNFDNCSGVIIGPVTQFHGPVNVFPSAVNGNVSCGNGLPASVKKETLDTNTGSHNTPPPKWKKLCPLQKCLTRSKSNSTKQLIIIVPVGVIIFIIVTVVTCYSVLQKLEIVSTREYYENIPDDLPTLPGPGMHHIVSRDIWGARPPNDPVDLLTHPIPLVIIIHTASSMCHNYTVCSQKVNKIQEIHMEKKRHPDIGYNFLIGGDANIYEGVGWDLRNYSMDDSISIAFTGNFIFNVLTDGMIEAAKGLIAEGVRLKKLSAFYTVVCHNQTKPTESPGRNVYQEVKTWPHFKPDKLYFY